MAHLAFEHKDFPGLILATDFDKAAGNASITQERADTMAEEIRGILEKNSFTSYVATTFVYGQFWGVMLLAEDFLPKAYGIGATYKDVPVIFNRIPSIKDFLARHEAAQRGQTTDPVDPPKPGGPS